MITPDDIRAIPLSDLYQWRTIAARDGEATQAFAECTIMRGRGYSSHQLCRKADGSWSAVVYDSGGMPFRHGQGATPLDAAYACAYFIDPRVEYVDR